LDCVRGVILSLTILSGSSLEYPLKVFNILSSIFTETVGNVDDCSTVAVDEYMARFGIFL
jgi:hypothetical protein